MSELESSICCACVICDEAWGVHVIAIIFWILLFSVQTVLAVTVMLIIV